MFVHHWVRCLQRPAEGIRSPRTSYRWLRTALWVLGPNLYPLQEQLHALTQSHLSSPHLMFLFHGACIEVKGQPVGWFLILCVWRGWNSGRQAQQKCICSPSCLTGPVIILFIKSDAFWEVLTNEKELGCQHAVYDAGGRAFMLLRKPLYAIKMLTDERHQRGQTRPRMLRPCVTEQRD